MWNILEAFTFLKKICWQFSRKWVLEKRHCLCLVLCLRASVVVPLEGWCASCLYLYLSSYFLYLYLHLFEFACLGSGSIGKVVSLVCCHRHHRHTQVYPGRKHKQSQKIANMDLANLVFVWTKMGTHILTRQVTSPWQTSHKCKYNDFCENAQNVAKRWTWACRCCRTQRRQAGQRCTAASPWSCRTMTCETSSYRVERFNLWN